MLIGKGYGLRDLKTKEPITPSTNMELASVSKQFTALSILSLVDKGQLSLSDSVYDLFPYPTFKDVTVEQLINHTSGLADAEAAFHTEWDASKIATNTDIINWYKKEDRKILKPGEKYEYNNGTYEVLPSIVEKISGQEYSKYVSENVFTKAGMKNTIFFNHSKPVSIKERASYYEKNDSGNWEKMDGHFMTGVLGAGGVYTSLEDYFQYDQALRNESIFSKATHQLIFKPSSTYDNEGETMNYAMGWGVSENAATHSGGWFGVSTYTKRYLDRPLTIAIFMNRSSLFNDDLVDKVDELALNYIKAVSEKN